MKQKMSKTSVGGAALVLVPVLAVVVLWLGMGQLSLSAVEIQDEAVAASTQVPTTLADDAGVVPVLKNWEYTRGRLVPLSLDLNSRGPRSPSNPPAPGPSKKTVTAVKKTATAKKTVAIGSSRHR